MYHILARFSAKLMDTSRVQRKYRYRAGLVLRVLNATRGVSLGETVAVADTSRSRRTGLLKHTSLQPGEGIWIVPCEAVHTFGMKFAIDVVFLSRKKKVLKIRKDMPKRRLSVCWRAHSVLEFPVGTIETTGTAPGDQLEFER